MLIQTKIHRPQIRDDLVPRPHLFARLYQGLDRPLILVCAGAGFGKTTLVSAWLHEIQMQEPPKQATKVAWLSLDSHDNDLAIFLHYCIAALQSVVPDACLHTAELLKAQQDIPTAHLFASLRHDLEHLPSKTILVLDDYHVIRDLAVQGLLNELFLHWPPLLKLVVISRYAPPLPIARLRAAEKVLEIRNQDLRFTSDEVAEYVHRVWATPLSQTSLDLIAQKTEGWIAGLQLAGLSLRFSENIEAVLGSLSGTNIDIAEYLADEVLSTQPSAVQTFLLKISILDRFCVSLCEAITVNDEGEQCSQDILDWFVHSNLFIIPLDNQQEWYRFHHLFRDLLRQRLLSTCSQDEITNLHRDAAYWFAREGLWDTAVYHALEAQDMNLAADFMEQNLCSVLNREDGKTLDRWLHLLPEEFINKRPGLLLIKAWYLSAAWYLEGVNQIIQRVEALLDQPDMAALSPNYRQILCGQIAVLKSQVAFHKGQPTLSIIYGQEALAALPFAWHYARGGVISYLALSMQAVGEGTTAEEMLLEYYESALDKTDNYASRLLFTLSLISLQAGKLEQAEQTARLLLQQAAQIESVILQGWAHLILGLVYYERNHLDLAEQHFNEIVSNRHTINSLVARQGNAGAILIHLAAGRLREATQLVDFLSEYDMELNGRLDDHTQSLRAKIWLAAHNIEAAGYWADTFTNPVAPIMSILLELPQLTRVQILLARGSEADKAQALQILQELTAVAEQNQNIRRKIEALSVTALALDAQEKDGAAKSVLKQAVELARPGGFIRVFVNLGPRMQAMLTALVMPTAYTEFVRRILAAFPDKLAPVPDVKSANDKTLASPTASLTMPASTPVLVESLTSREVQVLTLLREPLSAREIALKLNISYATAKRHSINLYGKLGVNSRWDAVARAESLGILLPR